MNELELIKNHVDGHGYGCAIVGDHVAIGVVWVSRTIGGEERRLETTERVQSFDEACGVIGCRCGRSAFRRGDRIRRAVLIAVAFAKLSAARRIGNGSFHANRW